MAMGTTRRTPSWTAGGACTCRTCRTWGARLGGGWRCCRGGGWRGRFLALWARAFGSARARPGGCVGIVAGFRFFIAGGAEGGALGFTIAAGIVLGRAGLLGEDDDLAGGCFERALVHALEEVEGTLGFCEFLDGLLALDEECTSVDADEGDGEFGEGVEPADCTCNGGVVHLAVTTLAAGCVAVSAVVARGFRTSFDDGDVGKLECRGDCTEEGDLLAGGFEEREGELREADGKGDTGEAAAGANIDHLAAIWDLDERLDERERIEDVLAPRVCRVGDGGEIEEVVGCEKHGEVAAELLEIAGIELDAECTRVVFKARGGRDRREGGEVGEFEGGAGRDGRGALGAAFREVVVGRFGAWLAGWAVGH
jgi:hypothetical protein